MGIPTIERYQMPGADDLPRNTVRWRAESHRAVLLVHDMQRYFLKPFGEANSPGAELIGNAVRLREECTRLGVPVVYTAQPGDMTPAQRGLLNDFWGPGMTTDPADREIIDELAPCEGDTVLTKWRYSAFHRSDLLDLMRSWEREQLIVCGIYAHVGVLMTTCDAFTHDIQPFLVGDAIADFSLDHHRTALKYAAQRCAMTVSTGALLTELAGSTDPVHSRPPSVTFHEGSSHGTQRSD